MGTDKTNQACTSRKKVTLFVRIFSRYGGVEDMCYRFYAFLKSRGVDVHVVCGRNLTDIKDDSVQEVGMLRPGRFLKMLSYYRRASLRLERLPKEVVTFSFAKVAGCDIYAGGGSHLDFMQSSMQGYRGLFKKTRKSVARALSPVNYLIPFLEKKIFTSTTTRKFIAVSSNVAAEIMRRFKLPPDRLIVINHGVDAKVFNASQGELPRNSLRQELGLPAEARIVGFCATNFELKGLRFLIESLSLLPGNCYLLVAGHRHPSRFIRLAGHFGVQDRVRFLGKVKDMARFYGSLDVLCHPSFYDSFGSVVTEALAMGVPAVTSDFVGAKDVIVAGRNGVVISVIDRYTIANAIQETFKISKVKNWPLIKTDEDVFTEYLALIEAAR